MRVFALMGVFVLELMRVLVSVELLVKVLEKLSVLQLGLGRLR